MSFFLNICVDLNEVPPTADGNKATGVVQKYYKNRPLDYVDQFIVLYHSIKQNWKFPCRVNLIHSTDFTEEASKRLSELDIDIFRVEPHFKNRPHIIRGHSYSILCKTKGTHRLIMDADMIALREPEFDLTTGAQCMYGGNDCAKKEDWEKICKVMGYDVPKGYVTRKNLFIEYHLKDDTTNFPYINNGCVLMKEEFCKAMSDEYVRMFEIFNQLWFPRAKWFGHQILIGPAINHITKGNWKMLPKGCNYLGKVLPLDTYVRAGNKIPSLYHYLGERGHLELDKYFSKYFEVL